MLAKVIALACFAALSGVGVAFAQTDGPAELPSADYAGQSYVDSNGCIFLKAGYGGQAAWVPRVGQDRKPICGQTPTNAVAKVSDASATDLPAAPKIRAKKPKAHAAAPHVPVIIGCPVSVPVARRYATTDGGSVVICTATNGSLTGARSPIYPAGSGVGASLSSNRYAGVTIPLPNGTKANAASPPPGYELAWKDDRLNPRRGQGTAEGQAAQDKLWTRDLPAKPIVASATPASKPAVAASAAGGSYYVQVGAFGEPSNAQGATARLEALGLPVSKGKFTSHGKLLQVVYAGPFASGADAQAALNAARGNGFSDAFIR
jgi:cell division septation protein DedD